MVSTFRRACRTFGLGRLGFTLEAHNRIPQARGRDFSTAEGVGSVPIPGGEPLHGGFHTVNYPVDPAITAAATGERVTASPLKAAGVVAAGSVPS